MAAVVRKEDPTMEGVTAFNKATTQFIEELKDKDLAAYEKLVADATEIRQASHTDYTDLSPDTLAQLLQEFPAKFNDELERQGKALPVHIWCITSFAVPPSQEMKTYTLEGISSSEVHSLMTTKFKSWMRDNLGASAARQIETAESMVYPDISNHMRPTLPVVVDVLALSSLQLRTSLRTYFNYTACWQGHCTGVPWKIIAKDERYHYINKLCFPPTLSHLQKVNDMRHEELVIWYRWILDGQERHLQPDQIFQFARLPQPDGVVVLEFLEPIITCPSVSNLTWTVEEKLYTRRVKKLAEDGLDDPSWGGLPLARVQEIYQPFSPAMRTAMSAGCSTEFLSAAIVSLTFDLEQYGPVHTRDLANTEPLIPYLGQNPDDGSLKALLLMQTLPTAALLEDDPEHPDYSVSTYIRMYEHCLDKVPASLVKAFDCSSFDRLKSQIISFGTWLLNSLQESISKLKISYVARAQAWKQAVVGQYLTRNTRHTGDESLRRDTHGIPRNMNALTKCYDELQELSPDITLGLDNKEFRKTKHRLRTREVEIEDELSDHDSTSSEEITLPDSNDSTQSHITNEINSQRLAQQSAVSDDDLSVQQNNLTFLVHMHDPTRKVVSPEPGTNVSNDLSHFGSGASMECSGISPRFQDLMEAPDDRASSADEGDLSNTILTDISPIKLSAVKPILKSRAHMQVEVVIPTPYKRTEGLPRASGSAQPLAEESSDSHEDEGDLAKSIAQRHPRRSIRQDPRVQEFIRSSKKGMGGGKPVTD